MKEDPSDVRTRAIEVAAGSIQSWGAVAVLGAGISFPSGLPLTRNLRELLWHALDTVPEARKALAEQLHEVDQPAKMLIGENERRIVAGLEVIRTQLRARRAFQEGFAKLNEIRVKTASPSHECIARLVHCGRVEIVISLNWDTLLEVSYQRLYGTLPPEGSLHKPHGDAAYPENSWVLPHEKGTISDALVAQLHSLALERPRVLLIVGYSERDDEVVNKIVRPLENRWRVIRIGPAAGGEGVIQGSASEILPELVRVMNLPSEILGWEYVSFLFQRDLSAALRGQKLGPADVQACPRLPEVQVVTRLLRQRHIVWLVGKSGSGKSITAYQVAENLVREGWETLRLKDLDRSDNELIMSVCALPRRTLLLLDDVERLDRNLILRLHEIASPQLLALFVALSEQAGRTALVTINEKRAVAEIAQCLRHRRAETLETVKALDNRVGEGYLDTSIELRIDEAAESDTPWQFMFVLTGGWRRTHGELEWLEKKGRSDLLLAAIAVSQIVNLDSEVSQEWLKEAARSLERNEAWIPSALRSLRERRLILGENTFRCPHNRFAAAVLSVFCKKDNSEEWPRLIALFRAAFVFGPPPLRGISWLLHDLGLTEGWPKMRGGALMDNDLLTKIVTRCFSAANPADRRDALFALTALLNWHPDVCARLASHQSELSGWLTEAHAEYAASFANFLNQLSQRDPKLARHVMDDSDPQRIAWSASETPVENAALWGRLLEESWHSDARWKRKLSANLNVSSLRKFFRRVQPADVGKAGMLAEGISALRQDLAIKLTQLALPAIAKALNNDPVETSAAIDSTIIWHVCGFYPEALATKRPSKPQVALARRLVHKLKPRAIAGALARYRQRDWEQYSRLLSFVRKVSPVIWKQITSSINLAKLETTAAKLWSAVPSELENLLRSISEPPQFEPARSLLTRHSNELVRLRPTLVILSPESAAERIHAGIEFDLHIAGGSGWRWAAVALHCLAKVDRTLPTVVLRKNMSAIASGFAKLQRLDVEDFPLFIEVLKTSAPDMAEEIAVQIVPKVARACWLERASGNRSERQAIRSLLKVLPTPNAPLRSLARRVQAELVRQKKNNRKREPVAP
jgi:hypothetical protein